MNNGYFEIIVGDDDRILDYNFHDEFTINEHYLNLPAGDYYVTVDYYTYDGSHWGGPEAWVTMESEPEPVEVAPIVRLLTMTTRLPKTMALVNILLNVMPLLIIWTPP